MLTKEGFNYNEHLNYVEEGELIDLQFFKLRIHQNKINLTYCILGHSYQNHKEQNNE